MSKNIVSPYSVSFEDALRNLASRLTGRPAAELPRTQEGIVQFMAENVPAPDEMAEAIIKRILVLPCTACAFATVPVEEESTEEESDEEPPNEKKPDESSQEAADGLDASGGTSTPEEGEEPDTEAAVAADKAKRGKSKAEK